MLRWRLAVARAADGGAGGIFMHWYFAFKWSQPEKADLDIFHLEAVTCVLWLEWICINQPQHITGKRFRMWCDNEPWVYTVNKGTSSWPAMDFLGNYCHKLMARYSFLLVLDYIPSKENIAADAASRFAWNEFFQHMRTSANMRPSQLVQVDLRAALPSFSTILSETRQLRCSSLSMLTALSTPGPLSPSTGQSSASTASTSPSQSCPLAPSSPAKCATK